MNEAQKVICISDNFPVFKTTSEDKSDIGTMPATHPHIGEVLYIDEVLGEFLRFDKYDCDNPKMPNYGFNWWHESRFRIVEDMEDILREEKLELDNYQS